MTEPDKIKITAGTTIEVVSSHGDDWFPLYIQSGLHESRIYLRRVQLQALQARLNEILGDSA